MFSNALGIILAPARKVIGYGALKLMKRIRMPDDKRPIIAASSYLLDELVLPSGFKIFRNPEFRELAGFKKLPVAEHDRIFNELEIAGICLAISYINIVKPLLRPSDYHFWQGVEEHLPKQFQKILISYGVNGGNAKLMRELIAMRYKEYQSLAEEVQGVNEEMKGEFKSLSPEQKDVASTIQAIAFGTTDHIRRGKIKQEDPLIKFLGRWLLVLYFEIGKFVRKL